jgi:hypothetical protein
MATSTTNGITTATDAIGEYERVPITTMTVTAEDPINNGKVTTTATSTTTTKMTIMTAAAIATAMGDGNEVDREEEEGGNKCAMMTTA